MHLTSLRLEHFRNHTMTFLEPGEGLNVFLGHNAQGKTNLLEALYLLTCPRPFRSLKLDEHIQWGESQTRVSGRVVDRSGLTSELSLVLKPGSRVTRRDGKVVKSLSDLSQTIRAVLFVSRDLEMVRGTPAGRRRFFDRMITVAFPQYDELLQSYGRVLAQKAALLAQAAPSGADLDIWNRPLAHLGARLVLTRERFIHYILPHLQAHFLRLSGNPAPLTLQLVSTTGASGVRSDAIEGALLELLERRAADECRAGRPLAGPHRDDFRVELDGRDLAHFGSQGQTRMLVLSLKMAELVMVRELHGVPPLFLLDDVSSELDEEKTSWMLRLLEESGCQIFLTTARYDPLLDHTLRLRRIFRVQDGRIST